MNERQLSYQDVLEIIKLVEGSDKFTDFRLRYDGVEIEMNTGTNAAAHASAPAARGPAVVEAPAPAAAPAAQPAPVSAAPVAQAAEPEFAEGLVVVRAPMVGTFYRSPEPGAKPFVDVGDVVGEHDTVCIIEVMKLMNTLSADTKGVVREILVADGGTVEYGQPLIVIEATS